MPQITVASANPVKINAARESFQKMFPDQQFETLGVKTASGVADQPMSCDETYCGAMNRLRAVRESHPDSDYFVAMEGGLEEIHGRLAAFAWMVVSDGVRTSKGRTGTFFLAPKIEELVRSGMEMGYADDAVFGTVNSKETLGATGILTKGLIDRAGFYEHAMILALIPFVNQELYPATL